MKYFQSSRSLVTVFWAIVLMWSAVIAWAFVFQINKSTFVSGVMQPYGKTFPVESSRDGKISKVAAKLGDVVYEGSEIMKLDTELDEVALASLESQLSVAQLKLSRFELLSAGEKKIKLDERFDSEQWKAEEKIFDTTLQSFLSEIELVDNEIKLANFQIENIRKKILSTVGQRELLEKQFSLVKNLFEKGYEGELSMLEVSLQLEGFDEQTRSLKSSIVEQEMRIATLDKKKESLKYNFLKLAQQGAYDAQIESKQILDKMAATTARIEQSSLVSPVDGRVSRFLVNNLGQFVKSGEAVAEIVPKSVPLMLYVKIPPEYISKVEIGQKANVSLNNMDTRNMKKLEGELLEVDGDASQDEKGGRFYSGIIRVVGVPAKFAVPGVQGTASLLLGTQTVAEYFLDPIWETLEKSMNE
jgi:HlyD family type I secretion membrane fusion protein